MKDLKCGLRECKYNRGYCCVAKQIDVDQGTDCRTFAIDVRKRDSMTEAGSDVAANYSVNTDVACTADCIFNRDNKCISNGITVMSTHDSPAMCLTFIKS